MSAPYDGLMKRMLITGGSGYLGGWVTRFAREDWDVTATYARHPSNEPGAIWRELDVRDAAAVNSLISSRRPDVIVHTAALNPGQGNDYEAVNIVGTANVARAAAEADTRLVHISTDMVFDGQKGDYVEADAPNPLTPYGVTKARAEAAVLDSGVAATIIYGWRPSVARSARWMINAMERGDTVNLWADEMRCPIWVESLAAAIVELAGWDYTGFLHVGGAQAVSRYEFGTALLRFAGFDPGRVGAIPSPPDELRPLDCTMDSSLARELLSTPLPGVDEVLARGDAIR